MEIKSYTDVLNYFDLLGLPINNYKIKNLRSIAKFFKENSLLTNGPLLLELHKEIMQNLLMELKAKTSNPEYTSFKLLFLYKYFDRYFSIPEELRKMSIRPYLVAFLQNIDDKIHSEPIFLNFVDSGYLKIILMIKEFDLTDRDIGFKGSMLSNFHFYMRNSTNELLIFLKDKTLVTQKGKMEISLSGNTHCLLPFLFDLEKYPNLYTEYRVGKNLIFRDTYSLLNVLIDHKDLIVDKKTFLKNIDILQKGKFISNEFFKDIVDNTMVKYSALIYN